MTTDSTNKPLTIDSLTEAMKLFEERMGECSVATNRFRDVLLIPSTFKIPAEMWEKEKRLQRASLTSLASIWGIPVIRTQYLPTVSLEPAMPTRTGRTRRGYKIAHKFALNERRRRSRFMGQYGYLIKDILNRQIDSMLGESLWK